MTEPRHVPKADHGRNALNLWPVCEACGHRLPDKCGEWDKGHFHCLDCIERAFLEWEKSKTTSLVRKT